jgi:hypothetical protein
MPTANSNCEETIHAFAKQNRLRTCREADGTTVVRGQDGCHLYEYGEGEIGLMILSDGTHGRRWAGIRKKCVAAGMTLRQNGDDEGSLSFNPTSRKQSRLAIKVTGARPKRRLSPEHRAKLLAIGFQKRPNVTLKGVSSDKSSLETIEVG